MLSWHDDEKLVPHGEQLIRVMRISRSSPNGARRVPPPCIVPCWADQTSGHIDLENGMFIAVPYSLVGCHGSDAPAGLEAPVIPSTVIA